MLNRIVIIIFLVMCDNAFSFTKYGIYNGKYLFSSKLENISNINFVINGNEVIFQNFTDKGYIYTIPENGKYKLENGGEFLIENGKVEKLIKKPDFMMNVEDIFYNDVNLECDSKKFLIAKKMLATNCDIKFHQYQVISQYPDFVRAILIDAKDLSKKTCQNSVIPIDIIVNMDEAIKNLNDQLSQLRHQISQMEANDQSKNEKGETIADLTRNANILVKKINDMHKWSFGIMDMQNVLSGSEINDAAIGDDIIAFYISSSNEIGCIPSPYVNFSSKSELKETMKILFDKYILLKPSQINHDKDNTLIELSNYNVKYYNKGEVKKWQDEMFDVIYGDKIADIKRG